MLARVVDIIQGFDESLVLGVAILVVLLATILAEQTSPAWLNQRGSDGRLKVNIALGSIGFAIEALTPLSAAAMSAIANHGDVGLLQRVDLDSTPRFITSFFLVSFAIYLLHRAAHRWSWMWRLHRVHHNDVALDVTSAFRHHPFERIVALVWLTAVGIGLGLSPGAIVLYGSLSLLFSIPQHANIALGSATEWALQWVFVTPGAHHIHHSAAQYETDSNYGDVLNCWDRLLGTWQTQTLLERRGIRVGLGDEHDLKAECVRDQFLSPFSK